MDDRTSGIEWDREDEFFVSRSPVRVPLLGSELPVRVVPERKGVSRSQQEALQALLHLPAEEREEFTHPLALDCWYTCQEFEITEEDPPVKLRKRAQVWRHIDFREVLIPSHGKSRDRYVFLNGRCGWDEEHGLEILLKNGRLLRVGRQGGLFCSEEWELYYISE